MGNIGSVVTRNHAITNLLHSNSRYCSNCEVKNVAHVRHFVKKLACTVCVLCSIFQEV